MPLPKEYGIILGWPKIGGQIGGPPAPPSLLALALSSSSYSSGDAPGTVIGAILNATGGSTLSLFNDNGGAVALSGSNLVVGMSAPTGAGSFGITVRETLAGASNTPRDTPFTITYSSAYDSDALALFNAMSVAPSSGDKTLINQVYLNMKAQGLYALLDDFSFPCLADAQASALRWKTPGTPSTVVGSPTFTAYRGWQMNGSSQYINTNYNPTAFVGQFAANSATFGVYANVDPGASDTWMSMGGSGSTAYLQPRRSGFAGFGYRINNTFSIFPQPMSPNSGLGLSAVTRVDNNNTRAFKNGVLLQAGTGGSIGSNLNDVFYVGANNNAGTPANYWAGRPAFWFAGGGLSDAQHSALYTIVNTFLTAIGAN